MGVLIMSVYRVNNQHLQMRLEPIVSLKDETIIGFEALSRTVNIRDNINFDYETFFRELNTIDHLYVIERQLEAYQKWSKQHPEIYGGKILFINVHPSILESDDYFHCFISFLKDFHIAIEIDSHLSNISEKAKNSISILKSFGVHIWIDDYLGSETINDSFWSGVKIDKMAFQKSFYHSTMDVEHINYRDIFNIATVIIEGIESKAHAQYAIEQGASYGQGYLWPGHLVVA